MEQNVTKEYSMIKLCEAYTAEEVAEYFRLHPYTVRRLAREKKIPAFRVGGQWRFRRDDIDNWSKAHQFIGHNGA